MTNLWKPDRQLTREPVVEVIRSSIPSFRTDNITFLGSRREFDAYLTSDGWVVRFPGRQEMPAPQIGGALPAMLPVYTGCGAH